MPQVDLSKTENAEYLRRSVANAPKGASRYRGWRVWYDPGVFESGIVYRETKWRAQRGQDRIEQDEYQDLKDLIDQIEGPADT